MLELREFRVHQQHYEEAGIPLVGISLDAPEDNRVWRERLRIRYPLLSDSGRQAGAAFGVIRRAGIAGWNVEFFLRTSFLVAVDGRVAGVWGKVKVRGHAMELLRSAIALRSAARHPEASTGH